LHRKFVAGATRLGCVNSAISAADEETFILSDEIIDHVYRFFPPLNVHHGQTQQACAALQAFTKVIGMVLCKIDCPWSLGNYEKAVESSLPER
jgi:hypothetical protein